MQREALTFYGLCDAHKETEVVSLVPISDVVEGRDAMTDTTTRKLDPHTKSTRGWFFVAAAVVVVGLAVGLIALLAADGPSHDVVDEGFSIEGVWETPRGAVMTLSSDGTWSERFKPDINPYDFGTYVFDGTTISLSTTSESHCSARKLMHQAPSSASLGSTRSNSMKQDRLGR